MENTVSTFSMTSRMVDGLDLPISVRRTEGRASVMPTPETYAPALTFSINSESMTTDLAAFSSFGAAFGFALLC